MPLSWFSTPFGNWPILRYLGIDYGTKRIGLAAGDDERCVATPLSVLERRGDIAQQIADVLTAADDFGADAFVLGIPFNMDGSEGKQVKITRDFGTKLAEASNKPVNEWDERLSSRTADIHLAEIGLTQKKRKARRDALAAQVILQTFLDAQRSDERIPTDE